MGSDRSACLPHHSCHLYRYHHSFDYLPPAISFHHRSTGLPISVLGLPYLPVLFISTAIPVLSTVFYLEGVRDFTVSIFCSPHRHHHHHHTVTTCSGSAVTTACHHLMPFNFSFGAPADTTTVARAAITCRYHLGGGTDTGDGCSFTPEGWASPLPACHQCNAMGTTWRPRLFCVAVRFCSRCAWATTTAWVLPCLRCHRLLRATRPATSKCPLHHPQVMPLQPDYTFYHSSVAVVYCLPGYILPAFHSYRIHSYILLSALHCLTFTHRASLPACLSCSPWVFSRPHAFHLSPHDSGVEDCTTCHFLL